MQVVNLLNADYADARLGSALAESVLATLTALLAGNEASRRRRQADVGYDQIQAAVARQVRACACFSSALAQDGARTGSGHHLRVEVAWYETQAGRHIECQNSHDCACASNLACSAGIPCGSPEPVESGKRRRSLVCINLLHYTFGAVSLAVLLAGIREGLKRRYHSLLQTDMM